VKARLCDVVLRVRCRRSGHLDLETVNSESWVIGLIGIVTGRRAARLLDLLGWCKHAGNARMDTDAFVNLHLDAVANAKQ
jgi:hypothetical protein